jgi:hypothetical protein
MSTVRSLTKKLGISTVAVGCLAFSLVGTAGATTSAAGSKATTRAERYFSCANAQKRADRVQRIESRFSAKFATENASEAKAAQSNDAHLVSYWQHTIAKQRKHEAYLVNYWERTFDKHARHEAYLLRLHRMGSQAKAAKMAEAACHVAMPSIPAPTTPPTAPAPKLSPTTPPTAPAAKPTTTTSSTAPAAKPTTTTSSTAPAAKPSTTTSTSSPHS